MTATHLDVSSGLNSTTACGKSLHGWANISRRRPIVATRKVNDTTCKLCIHALGVK